MCGGAEKLGLELPLLIPLDTSLLEVSLTVSLFETLGQCTWRILFKCEPFKTENVSSLLKVAALSSVYACVVFVIDVKLVAVSTVTLPAFLQRC